MCQEQCLYMYGKLSDAAVMLIQYTMLLCEIFLLVDNGELGIERFEFLLVALSEVKDCRLVNLVFEFLELVSKASY